MEVKKRIGYLPELPPLYPEMEVVEYLEYVGRLKGVPKESLARRVDEAAEKCSVGDVKSKLIGKLLKGYRQRVGLARAVFGDPFLIVLDEPNANLDAEGENALNRAIQYMRQNKSIVVVISHRPTALSALNMAMVLYEGKAIAFGPSEQIFARVQGNAGAPAVTGPAAAAPKTIQKAPVAEAIQS